MRESSKPIGDSVSLILNAKYHAEEGSRALAGDEAVAYCISVGDHMSLANMSVDADFPAATRAKAKMGILEAAGARAKALGNDDPYFDIMEMDSLDTPTKNRAAAVLEARYREGRDVPGLLRVCCCKPCNYQVREDCGDTVVGIAEESVLFSLLFELAANPEAPYESRKKAGISLIRLAIEHGNFPILLRLDQIPGVPTDVRIELDGKADIAAQRAVGKAIESGDTYMLQTIKDASQLSEPVRSRASEAIDSLAGPEPSPLNGLPGNDLARELMLRLARQGGVGMSSERPPSIRPTPQDLKKSSQ